MLTSADEERIAEAVSAAEEKTAGEIVCVIAPEVSNYREVPLAWAAAVALILPPVALLLGVEPMKLATNAGVWIAGQARALESEFMLALSLYAIAQAALFLLVFAICEIPGVRRILTPAILKRHRVDRVAQQQFAAIGARAVGSPGGVMIFVAHVDRQVRILPSASTRAATSERVWAEAATAITVAMKSTADPSAGIIEAIRLCGAALEGPFPNTGAPHVLSNRPIDL